jgi:hypothetical protein
MEKGTLMRLAPVVGVLVALSLGCFVQIDHVSDPTRAFSEARAEAARLSGRQGPAHEVNVLVFEPEDHELVRVSLPLWLVRKLARGEGHLDDDADRAFRSVKAHVRLEDLERAGLGTLVEVESDDGEQVLVWLR